MLKLELENSVTSLGFEPGISISTDEVEITKYLFVSLRLIYIVPSSDWQGSAYAVFEGHFLKRQGNKFVGSASPFTWNLTW